MDAELKKRLKELAYNLRQVGSGLDAVDKTGSWSHYKTHVSLSESGIKALPPALQDELATRQVDMNNWSRLEGIVNRILRRLG